MQPCYTGIIVNKFKIYALLETVCICCKKQQKEVLCKQVQVQYVQKRWSDVQKNSNYVPKDDQMCKKVKLCAKRWSDVQKIQIMCEKMIRCAKKSKYVRKDDQICKKGKLKYKKV